MPQSDEFRIAGYKMLISSIKKNASNTITRQEDKITELLEVLAEVEKHFDQRVDTQHYLNHPEAVPSAEMLLLTMAKNAIINAQSQSTDCAIQRETQFSAYLQGTISVLGAENAQLRIAVNQAHKWFSEYATLHGEKGTIDGDKKAAVNSSRAVYLLQVLTQGIKVEHKDTYSSIINEVKRK